MCPWITGQFAESIRTIYDRIKVGHLSVSKNKITVCKERERENYYKKKVSMERIEKRVMVKRVVNRVKNGKFNL